MGSVNDAMTESDGGYEKYREDIMLVFSREFLWVFLSWNGRNSLYRAHWHSFVRNPIDIGWKHSARIRQHQTFWMFFCARRSSTIVFKLLP